ncbi:hypothetical protein SAMN05216503_3276 [Polaribacter sp. KT25b]|uniref:hypothetical protein n=1 Tax=Polaribacter sp. KT25b TaxID=1855336 RepID=UPI00087D66A6|nr:hypothetical protein [Polaribacter sp. KT25b]SDS50525.1 hypothetical protein SAMN05216503_3276 [Polaribacter sp. KT25b]
MKTKTAFLSLFLTVFLFSCEINNQSNELIIDPNDSLLFGYWAETSYEDEQITFTRVNSLPNDSYGISFVEKGVFIERSSGWCGTPPLTFTDYTGTWEFVEDSLVKISTTSFIGDFQWRILEVSEEKLVVKRELSEKELEHRSLMDLFNEIQNLSYSISCSDAADWNFVAYGSKACGGPKGYIAYSSKIDTTAFLQKIETYTQTEKDFNIKWGVISDCSITNPPTSVECQNGFPKLIY